MANVSLDKSSVVLLDVAGTTTSLSFVKDTLGPYVVKQAESFLKANWDDAEVQKSVKLLLLENVEANASAVAAAVKDLTEKNSDNEGLKNLQGLIARTGYEDGSLKGHVFADVSKSLESWAKDRKIAVFSTGSVEAQKLLFAHSTEGDLSAHISKYFDPAAVGAKTESGSYVKIAEELAVEPEKIIYLSDLIEELKAAKEAGLATVLVMREGNPAVSDDSFARVSSFSGLVSASAKGKRKNEAEDEIDAAADPEVMPWPLAKPELSVLQPPAKVSKVEADPSTTAEGKEETTMQVDDVNGSEVSKETKLPEKAEEAEKEKTEPTAIDAEAAKAEEEPMEVDGKKKEEEKTEAIAKTEPADKEVVETKDAETKEPESKDKEGDVGEKAPVETVNGKAEEAGKVEEVTNGAEKVEDSTDGVEKVEDNTENVDESVKKVQEKVEESVKKVQEKVEESTEKVEKVEGGAQKGEETANGKAEEVEGKNGAVIEEKNGEAEKTVKAENGDAVESAAKNGDVAEETTNGSHAATETDEIKVKKVEVTSTEEQPPAVAV